VTALVAELAASADPDAAFLALNESDRDAVVAFNEVAELESDLQLSSVGGAKASGTGAMASICWSFQKTVNAKNTYGMTMWTYWSRGEWCGDGSRITSTIGKTRGITVNMPYWEFTGHDAWQTSGGVGMTYWHTYTQGHFQNCFPVIGCVQHRYPWVDLYMYGSGSASGSYGG
jgi:hypothetical protein